MLCARHWQDRRLAIGEIGRDSGLGIRDSGFGIGRRAVVGPADWSLYGSGGSLDPPSGANLAQRLVDGLVASRDVIDLTPQN